MHSKNIIGGGRHVENRNRCAKIKEYDMNDYYGIFISKYGTILHLKFIKINFSTVVIIQQKITYYGCRKLKIYLNFQYKSPVVKVTR